MSVLIGNIRCQVVDQEFSQVSDNKWRSAIASEAIAPRSVDSKLIVVEIMRSTRKLKNYGFVLAFALQLCCAWRWDTCRVDGIRTRDMGLAI